MPTTITVRADVERASREIKQIGKDVAGVGESADKANRSIDQAFNDMVESIHDAQKAGEDAAKAVGDIASTENVEGLGELQQAVEKASESMGGIVEAAAEAAGQVDKTKPALDRSGEAAKQAAEAAGTFAMSLAGGSGVSAAVQGVLPKLTNLTGFLSGPWAAAITAAVGVLGLLIADLYQSEEASNAAAEGVKRHEQATASYIETLRRRLEGEAKLRGMTASNAAAAVEALEVQKEIQEELVNASISGIRQQEQAVDKMKKDVEQAKAVLESAVRTGRNPSEEQRSSLVEREQQAARAEENLNKLRQERIQLIEEQGRIERELDATRKVAVRREREENAKKAEELKKQEAEKKKAAEQTPQSGSLPPAAAAQQKVDQQAVQQRKAQATEAMEQAAKHDAELRAQRKKENADYINALREAHKTFIDGLARRLQTDEGGNVAQQIVDSVTPQQIAQTVGQQRFEKREEELRKQFESQEKARQDAFNKRREEINRNATNPSESGLLAFNEFGAQSQRARIRFNQELQREQRNIQRQAYRDTTSGSLNPEEMRAAQQANVEALTSQAQASGNLNSQTVEALKQSTQQLLQNQSEIESLQNTVASIQNTLKQSQQQGTRRRAQMGGAR